VEKLGFVILIILVLVTPLALMFGLGAVVERLFFRSSDPEGPLSIPDRGIKAINYFVPGEVERVLQQKFSYYQRLIVRDKQRFARRVEKFISKKEFIGKGGLTVTSEMSILIAASAIQLTFGLEQFMLGNFTTIFVYPKEYYNRFTKKYHKGEVNLNGVIVFSWEDFKEGYAVDNDNYNLGLHEMAHALRFDKMRSDVYDRFFAVYIDRWIMSGLDEFHRVKKGNASMLRQYAGTNINEFFSVCVEYFFESPALMKEKLPEIYKHMCVLLNQDPLQVFDSGKPVRASFFKHPADKGPLITELKEKREDPVIGLAIGAIAVTMMLLGGGAKMLWPACLFGGMTLLSVFFRARSRAFLYQEALVIRKRNVFREREAVYYFSAILTASFFLSGGKYKQELMKLCYSENGEIQYVTETGLDPFSWEERKKVLEMMYEKKILVRHNGELFLPKTRR
jgi:Mlc titration factor MtfA (ptsG expression regulator)